MVLCDDIECLDMGEGRKTQEGGGMYIIMTDLRCCIAETNMTL